MIIDLLKKRSSVRLFDGRPIPKETINQILEAGRLSPSGGNEQAWRFGLIDQRGLIEEIANLSYHQSWMKSASFLMVLCTEIVPDERGGRHIQTKRYPHHKEAMEAMDKDLYASLNLEEHQTKIPGSHMVLRALEEGIYSTWVSYFDVKAVQKRLNLPAFIIPSEIIAFGYPKEAVQVREKKFLSSLVFCNDTFMEEEG